MQIFHRDNIRRHCVGQSWPDPLGHVALGESFVIETERFNDANGPILVEGVGAGDDLAIHVEAIDIVGPFRANNGGPLIAGPEPELQYRDGWFEWPRHFRLRAKPSIGNVAILPEPTDEIREMAREIVLPDRRIPHIRGWRRVVNDPRGKHCHQDCQFLTAGSIIHMKAQVPRWRHLCRRRARLHRAGRIGVRRDRSRRRRQTAG
jgi:acetamidase/formamidase